MSKTTATTAAEKLVGAVEQLEAGQPFAEAVEAAAAAIEELREAARLAAFPRVAELRDPGAAYAALARHEQYLPTGPSFGRALAGLHGDALGRFDDLAALIRSASSDVAAHAAARASGRPEADVAAEAVARFEATVARQLVAAGHELAEAAGTIVAAHDLERRLDAARRQHEAHAAAEVARAQEIQRQADEAAARERARLVLEAAQEAEDLHRQALQAAERARVVRAQAFRDRLRLCGLRQLWAGNELFLVEDLAKSALGFSIEQLRRYEAALDAAVGRRT